MNQDLLNLLKQRRSIYALGKDVKQNPDDLVDLIETVIQETPTAFNSQTTRAVFLFGEQHDKLWDIVVKRLESEVPTEQAYEATKQKIAAQLNTWVTLANNGIGANLQHYNPIIDDLVREAFDIPTNRNLRAQMPFGSIEGSAKDKDYMDRKDQFKVLK